MPFMIVIIGFCLPPKVQVKPWCLLLEYPARGVSDDAHSRFNQDNLGCRAWMQGIHVYF